MSRALTETVQSFGDDDFQPDRPRQDPLCQVAGGEFRLGAMSGRVVPCGTRDYDPARRRERRVPAGGVPGTA